MKKHNILLAAAFTSLALMIGFSLAACQRSNRRGEEQAAPKPAEMETQETQETEESIGSGDEKRNAGKAEGYQFVTGYGICEPNQDVIWQLAPGENPSVEGELGKAELLQAVYQNQVLAVTVRLTDHSVTKVSEEEKNAFLEKEKENQLRGERGEPEEELPEYICIDSEQPLYVESTLQERIKREQKKGMGDRLYGAGISDRGFSFNSAGTFTEYESFLNEGYLMSVSEMRITAVHFDMKEPEGTYTLQLAGFDEPLCFSFVKAPEYRSLDAISGIVEEDGCYILAVGTKKEKGISVLCYTWPGEGYDRMSLKGTQLIVEAADGTQQTVEQSAGFQPESFPIGSGNELFSGFVNGNLEDYWFELPKDREIRTASLNAQSALLRSDAVSDEVTIPVPQGELPLDETVELGGAKLHLTGVSALDGMFEVGSVDGRPVMRPSVYVKAGLEPADSEKSLDSLFGIDSRYKFGSPELQYVDSHSNHYTKIEADIGDSGTDRELKGLYLYYEEGEKELKVRFMNPFYRWNRSFEVPVRIGKLP